MPTTELTTSISMREKVERLESEIMGLPQVDCPIRHYFAPGLYAREVFIPAGTLVTGMVHKTDNLIVLSKGRIQVATDDGSIELFAPHTMLCKAGTKNAVHAIEDTVWTNFHPTKETDLAKLAEIFTESTADELLGGPKNKQLLANLAAAQLEV